MLVGQNAFRQSGGAGVPFATTVDEALGVLFASPGKKQPRRAQSLDREIFFFAVSARSLRFFRY